MKYTTVKVPADIVPELKFIAAKEGLTLERFVGNVLRTVVDVEFVKRTTGQPTDERTKRQAMLIATLVAAKTGEGLEQYLDRVLTRGILLDAAAMEGDLEVVCKRLEESSTV